MHRDGDARSAGGGTGGGGTADGTGPTRVPGGTSSGGGSSPENRRRIATRAAASDAPGEADAAFRELLRSLRVRDATRLPVFDPETAPAAPLPLFRRWLREAAESGIPAPHTMTLATVGADGRPSVRTVMLHDADERGWHFGTHRTSRKGRELADCPYAALGFYWPALGRQVRIGGRVTAAGPRESAADLGGRSTAALAAALVGRQSEVLPSYEVLVRAAAAAWERAEQEPEAPVPTWTRYVVHADEVEFYQEEERRRHVRLRYRRRQAPGSRDHGGGGARKDGNTCGDEHGRGDEAGRGGGAEYEGDEGSGSGSPNRWRRELLWP
jgi:pyridoxamine 5'-phosphate oxidase